ncbi:MAG: hypothetical protein AB1916_15420 [Thermodesulfobacteriota bacterium]
MKAWEIVLWVGVFSWGLGSLGLSIVNIKNFRLIDFNFSKFRGATPLDKKLLMISGMLLLSGGIIMMLSLIIKGIFYG